MLRDTWGVNGSSHILGAPELGLTQAEQVPLDGLKMRGTNRRALRNLGSTSEEHTHLLIPKIRQRKQNELSHESEWFSAPTLVHSH